MDKLAFVVQRCHPDIVGGSEALALQYADLLRDRYQVEVLTTTALHYETWDNELPAGEDRIGDIPVRRFPVATGRSKYWWELSLMLSDAHLRDPSLATWRLALQEEYLRHQGPYSDELHRYLADHHQEYRALVFCTYLYATTYFALDAVPRDKALLVPTLHDEPPAYMSAFRLKLSRMAGYIWLTEAERRLARRLWGVERGAVVGMQVHTEEHAPERRARPYLLYAGRIDRSKHCDWLFEYFRHYKDDHPGPLQLLLIGSRLQGGAEVEMPERDDIEYLGFVDADRKYALMAGAEALMMPSPFESFSIVSLEAMAQGVPVIANGKCEVMADHVQHSGCGYLYDSPEAFADAIRACLGRDPQVRRRQAEQGRAYVLERYSRAGVAERLAACVGQVGGKG